MREPQSKSHPSRAALAQGTEADPRWQLVLARAGADRAAFFYGVRSTGIYCRPSCPARRPAPANLVFFDDADAAEAAGFRPCLRCAPRGTDARSANAALVAEAARRIEAAEAPLALKDLAAGLGLSPFYLHRLFRAATGLTPGAWAKAARGARMRAALSGKGGASAPAPAGAGGFVTGAALAAGYGRLSRYYEQAAEDLGMTATARRAGGAGETIRYALRQTPLGMLLAAQSGQGICAIALGEDPALLEAELQSQFPKARLIADDPEFEADLERVLALTTAPGRGLDLPLDLRGTAFQRRVWQALREIPPGSTLSYAQLAGQIGAPKAVRAVAGACAANKLAIAVPCHRVLRSDGALSGYRWGVARKSALLKGEKEG